MGNVYLSGLGKISQRSGVIAVFGKLYQGDTQQCLAPRHCAKRAVTTGWLYQWFSRMLFIFHSVKSYSR
jgi:hypothetical protein